MRAAQLKKKEAEYPRYQASFIIRNNQIARLTLPERKQRVQTLIRFTEPFTTALTC